MRVNNVHLRQAAQVVDIEFRSGGVALHRGTEPVVAPLHHHAQRAPLALEGAGFDVYVLVRIAGALNLIIHGDQHAFALGILGGSHADGAEQVQRPIGRQRRARAHGADHGNRLVGVHGQAQKVGGFGQRIGAVGDNDAIHIGLLGQGRNALGQRQQVVVGKALGGNLEYLFTRDVGNIGQLRQPGQQLVHGHFGGRVGGAVGRRSTCTGNRPASGQHHHVGFGRLRCRRRSCWCDSLCPHQGRSGRKASDCKGRSQQGLLKTLEGHGYSLKQKSGLVSRRAQVTRRPACHAEDKPGPDFPQQPALQAQSCPRPQAHGPGPHSMR